MIDTLSIAEIKDRIDFAIITVRDDEFEAVAERFKPYATVLGGKRSYLYSNLTRPDGRALGVAIVKTFAQGQTAAQLTASQTLHDLNPRWLILAGIAGGFPSKDFSLGDVLLASSLIDVSITAELEDKPREYRTAGGPVHAKVANILSVLPALKDKLGTWNQEISLRCPKPDVVAPDELESDCYYGPARDRHDVRDAIRASFPLNTPVRPPLFKSAALATGNTLVKNTQIPKEWRSVARQIEHVEMEAGGVYEAARHTLDKEVPLLSVRGISDVVGFKRGDEWTAFACHSAASLVQALLLYLPTEMFFDASQTPIPPISTSNAPTIDQIIKAFKKSSTPLLVRKVNQSDWISRPEDEQIQTFLADTSKSVMFLLGAPGSGKTALLAHVAQRAIDDGVPTLAIKADLLLTEKPFEDWGARELNYPLSAFEAVQAVSSKSRTVVLVDQLDALSSTVDLKSERLVAVLRFIADCSELPNVSLVCSCRTFDYHHDARFSVLNPASISLELPNWEAVAEQLEKHGIKNAAGWSQAFRDLLRTPQHLHVFLEQYESTGKLDAFASYHLMLDELWERTIKSQDERELLYKLTARLMETEMLWAPIVHFENEMPLIESLEGKQILQRETGQIGFRHQSLLEHAKARYFTKTGQSLCQHVVERQNALFVRPTLWAVLQYLRAADPQKYEKEIKDLFGKNLRLHIRFLLLDFLGWLPDPKEFEIALFAKQLVNEEESIRALLAIRGNSKWFAALKTSHFPTVMRASFKQGWAMVGVIAGAWEFDRDACLDLIETNWLNDLTKDDLTWRAMTQLAKWDERAVKLVRRLIEQTQPKGDRLFWAEQIVSIISKDQPALAPGVFIDAVKKSMSQPNEEEDA